MKVCLEIRSLGLDLYQNVLVFIWKNFHKDLPVVLFLKKFYLHLSSHFCSQPSTHLWSGNCLSSSTKLTSMEVARGNGNVHWTSHTMMMLIMMTWKHLRSDQSSIEWMLNLNFINQFTRNTAVETVGRCLCEIGTTETRRH